ncbi:P-loop containing nucleoside triphosphate hydrolase protein [Paraphoma chrysanthemicola]|nr:P-loop containing nucleoside triphosphate hydrolase protein [Paraphoma chrysanthemicola]
MATPTQPTRLVDSTNRTRTKPMRILVLGMPRTGTSTLSTALRKLGYTPHQMRQVLANPEDLALWHEAINVTLVSPPDRPIAQRSFKPYHRAEFDKLLADYDVVMDLPGCVLAQPLLDAYPEAKVILTTRKYEDWEASMQESIWCLCTWRLFALARYFDVSSMAPLMRLMHAVFRVHNGNHYGGPQARAAYEKHYAVVRELVPREQLLEIDPQTSDWVTLCGFLEKEVPDERWPRMAEEKDVSCTGRDGGVGHLALGECGCV